MKFAARFSFSVVLVVLLVPFLNGQQRTASSTAATTSALSQPDGPDSCAHLFTAGTSSSNTYIQFCVTDNGNISSIETPFGHPMLGPGGEGYGLCQESPAAEYHDYLVSSSGWGPAQILAATASAIKISRTTNDARWTLVQTISKVAGTASIKVVMALTNNSRSDQVAYLLRFADIDPDAKPSNPGGSSLESAWGWDTHTPGNYGLQLQNAVKSPFSYQKGFVYLHNPGPNACDFAFDSSDSGLIIPFPGHPDDNPSVSYTYAGVVPALQTLTVTLSYHAL